MVTMLMIVENRLLVIAMGKLSKHGTLKTFANFFK